MLFRSPYVAKPANVNLNDKNITKNTLSALSEKFDFSQEDKVPDLIFNDVLWKTIKGINYTTPGPSRAAFVKSGNKKKDDN